MRCFGLMAGVLLGVGLVAPAPAQGPPTPPDSRKPAREAVKTRQVKIAVSGMT